MKVALDGTPLTLATGGLARYTAELSRALAAQFPSDEFLLLSDQPFPGGAGPRRGWARRWWTVGLSRELARGRVDIFHGTNFEVPYLPLIPSVLTLHDLSPWRDAAWRPAASRVRRRTPFLVGLGIAGMVITVSEAVRREAIEWFRIPPGRVKAIPLAAAP